MYTDMIGTPEPDLLGLAHPGDLVQGQGQSTVSLQNPNTPLSPAGHKMALPGSILQQSPLVWAVVIALLVVVKLVAENAGEKGEFSTVRIGLENWFVVGALAATFLFVLKVSSALIPSTAYWAQSVRQFAGMT